MIEYPLVLPFSSCLLAPIDCLHLISRNVSCPPAVPSALEESQFDAYRDYNLEQETGVRITRVADEIGGSSSSRTLGGILRGGSGRAIPGAGKAGGVGGGSFRGGFGSAGNDIGGGAGAEDREAPPLPYAYVFGGIPISASDKGGKGSRNNSSSRSRGRIDFGLVEGMEASAEEGEAVVHKPGMQPWAVFVVQRGCDCILRFVFHPLCIIDAVAILPWYVSLFTTTSIDGGLTVLRVLRLARVMRLLRTAKRNTGYRLLMRTLKQSAGSCVCTCGVRAVVDRFEWARSASRLELLVAGIAWAQYFQPNLPPASIVRADRIRHKHSHLCRLLCPCIIFVLFLSADALFMLLYLVALGVILFGAIIYFCEG